MELSLARPAMLLGSCAEKFGPRLQTHLSTFRSCMKLASEMVESNADPGPLESQIGLLDDTLDALPDSDVLYHHITALCSAATAFGCVSTENPPKQLDQIIEETSPSIKALEEMHDSSHLLFAKAVASMFDALKEWVQSNLPNGMKGAAPSSASPSSTSTITNRSQPEQPNPRASTPTAPHLVQYKCAISDGVIKSFMTSAGVLGGRVADVANPVKSAFDEVYEFLVLASGLPGPPNDDTKQEMIKKVVEQMTIVSRLSSECPSGDKFFNHIKAIEEAMNMLSWIVATEKPITLITDAEGSSSFYLNKVLTASKNVPGGGAHKDFVDALKGTFSAMREYVRDYHTMGVHYGLGIHAAKSSAADVTSPVSEVGDAIPQENYVSTFKDLIGGPLAIYLKASEALGGEVAEQALLCKEAWLAEAEFLEKAICTSKPDADAVQTMLAPVAQKMGAVNSFVDKVDPRGPFAHHCNAVAESIGALGWIAVEEKATAFVGDMSGAGQFFVDKVKMGAKTAKNPDFQRAWAEALESVFTNLKAYVKEHHTQCLHWNPPVQRSAAKLHTAVTPSPTASDAQANYVIAYGSIISGPLADFVAASEVLGGDVKQQAQSFANAWSAEAAFLTKAFNTSKPAELQEMIQPIASEMEKVAAFAESTDPRGRFANHCTAVAESVSALGWVAVEEKATAFVGDMAGAGQFFLDKVKMDSKKLDKAEDHRTWAKALEALYAALKAYVKEYHTQRLVWNPPKGATTASNNVPKDSCQVPRGTDYLAAFDEIIDGSLDRFISASAVLGTNVNEQGLIVKEAWKAERDFLAKAKTMPKPGNIDEMVAPIGSKMAEVVAIVDKIDPRGPFANHCNAVAESISALGWVAVDEKATAFVGDMAGAGQFFIDKVKMDAKKSGDPSSHRTWAQALEGLLKDLKAYVKEYHTQRLNWKQM